MRRALFFGGEKKGIVLSALCAEKACNEVPCVFRSGVTAVTQDPPFPLLAVFLLFSFFF